MYDLVGSAVCAYCHASVSNRFDLWHLHSRITVKQICSGGSFVYVYLAAPTDLMGWLRIPLEGAFYFMSAR